MKIIRLLLVAFTAAFFYGPASAQNSGTVTNHAFAVGKGPGVQGLSSVPCATAGMLPVGQTGADPICRTVTGDVTITSAGVTAIGTAKVTFAMIQNVAALSVIGRSVNSSGVSAAISCVAASDAVLRESGSVLGCGTIATNGIANNAVTNAKLATMGAYTLKGNNSGSTATPGDIDITALTAKASPVSADIVLIQDSAASNAFKRTTVGALSSAGSVSSIAGNTGAFTLGYGLTNSVNDLRASLTSITNSLGSDVAITVAGTYVTGPTVAQGTSGTWFASGSVTIADTTTAGNTDCKLWDGTTVISSSRMRQPISTGISMSLSGVITSPAGNIRISCTSNTTTSTIVFNATGTSKDSTVTAVRIAP